MREEHVHALVRELKNDVRLLEEACQRPIGCKSHDNRHGASKVNAPSRSQAQQEGGARERALRRRSKKGSRIAWSFDTMCEDASCRGGGKRLKPLSQELKWSADGSRLQAQDEVSVRCAQEI